VKFPGLKQVMLWTSAAGQVFANGFLHGLPAGLAAGSAVLKATRNAHFAVYAGLGAALTNAGKRVLVWSDANPIPNPFPGWVTPADSVTPGPAAAGPGPSPSSGPVQPA
jgi:hypothetical protein